MNIYFKGLAFGDPDEIFKGSEYSEYDMSGIIDDIIYNDDIYDETTFEGGETPLSAEEKTYYKEFVDLCSKLVSDKWRVGEEVEESRRENFFTNETGIDYLDYCMEKMEREEWNERWQRHNEREEEAMLYGTDEISFYSEDDFDF